MQEPATDRFSSSSSFFGGTSASFLEARTSASFFEARVPLFWSASIFNKFSSSGPRKGPLLIGLAVVPLFLEAPVPLFWRHVRVPLFPRHECLFFGGTSASFLECLNF